MLVDELFSALKEVWNLKETYLKAKQEKREKIALLFEKISQCLETVYNSVRSDQFPFLTCSMMETYAQELPDIVKGVMSESKAKDLSDKLLTSHRVELIYDELKNSPDRDQQLGKLLTAAGKLKALADILRAK